ncbi:MAG: FliO/MopB family protein [bacterium]|nr:FliO/MopB family protein [bacterium]
MTSGFWINYFVALLVVALMLGGLYAVVRGLARGRVLASADRRLVSVLESTMLSQHGSVHVVKVGTRYFLLGGGSHASPAALAELPAEEIEAWLAEQRTMLDAQRASLLGAFKALRRKP